MRKRTAIIGLVTAFLVIELVRRSALTLICFVDLRYNPNSFRLDRDLLRRECVERHLYFPFHLFS